MKRADLLVSATVLLLMGCSAGTAETGVDGAPDPGSVPTTESAPGTTEERTSPPTTDEQSNIPEPGDNPIGGATLDVSPTMVRVGDEVTITAHCPLSDDTASVWFDDWRANHLYIELPPTSDDPTEYVGTATVPYYLAPGRSFVHAGCVEGVRNPEPVEIEIVPSVDGYVELWRPLDAPWAEYDRPLGVAPPPLPDERFARGWDTDIPVHALCDADIPHTGARFIVWAPLYIGSADFVSVEYPVPDTGYDPVEGGLVISATLNVDEATFTAEHVSSDVRVSALCVATPTPFTPETEPRLPRLLFAG